MPLRDIPKIPVPNGALAIEHQLCETETVPAPMFMFSDFTAAGIKRKVPHRRRSSSTTALLYRAYLATRTVVAAETPADAQAMYDAETREIVAAAKERQPMDGSIPPRRMSVTLLAHETAAGSRVARTALDALAHLAGQSLSAVTGNPTVTASLIRFAVLAGPHARIHSDQSKQHTIWSTSSGQDYGIELAMRWAEIPSNAFEPELRTEFFPIVSGMSPDALLSAMQAAMLEARIKHNIPFPLAVSTHHCNVSSHAWARAQAKAAEAFFRLMEGEPAVVKHPAIKEHGIDIGASGAYVRICNRSLGEKGISDATAFHGMLLANSQRMDDVVRFCNAFSNGLPPPDEQTIGLMLHTCAVQAEGFQLDSRVTLFDHHGIPGEPIRSPGSWIWRLSAAIMPVDARLLHNFALVPCSAMSTLPGNNLLERSFREFFRRASDLFKATFAKHGSAVAGDAFERLALSSPARPEIADTAAAEAERFALAAFGIDATSRRITVGDAFTILTERQAPKPVCDFMLKATMRWGIGTSLLDAFGKTSELITTCESERRTRSAEQENERLRRIADAALSLSGIKRARRSDDVASFEIDNSRLKSLFSAAGIRPTKRKADMPKKGAKASAYGEVVALLASAVVKSTVETVHYDHACQTAMQARRHGTMRCIGNVVCVLRASLRSLPSTTFVVAQTDGLEGVSFSRVLPCGGMERVTAGTIVDTPVSSVVLVRMDDTGGAARLREMTSCN